MSQELGTANFANGNIGQSKTISGDITLMEPTTVTYSAAKDGGTESATLAGSIRVPAAKRNVAWDDVIGAPAPIAPPPGR